MKLDQMRKVLTAAEHHYRQDGRQEIADALSSFRTNLLKGNDSETVAAFVKRIKNSRKLAIGQASRNGSSKRRKARELSEAK